MNKYELESRLAEELGITHSLASKTLETMCEIIRQEVINGENVKIRGFGRFHRVDRAPRPTWSFKEQKTIILPASKRVEFSPADSFKKAVNPEPPKRKRGRPRKNPS